MTTKQLSVFLIVALLFACNKSKVNETNLTNNPTFEGPPTSLTGACNQGICLETFSCFQDTAYIAPYNSNNPYDAAGRKHNEGLDYLIENVDIST